MLVAKNKTFVFLSTLVVAGVGTIVALRLYHVHGKNQQNENDGDHDDNETKRKTTNTTGDNNKKSNNKESSLVPSHIQREIYKEKQLKAKAHHLTMKKPMYDNIEMYGPTGIDNDSKDNDEVMLCTISKKKAIWYVEKKQLAIWRTPILNDNSNVTPSIRLLFTPKNQRKDDDSSADTSIEPNQNHARQPKDSKYVDVKLYNTSHKQNICVCCGISNNLMRHYVVPYSYRRLLPPKYKSHLPHDIVLLCINCHIYTEQTIQQEQITKFEYMYRKYPYTAKATIPNRYHRHIKSCAKALWKQRHKLPTDKVIEYEQAIREYISSPEKTDNDGGDTSLNTDKENNYKGASAANVESIVLTAEFLQGLAENTETETPNPYYVPIAELVVRSLKTDQDIREFVRKWRQMFVETLRPRYLPIGWSVASPVECDM